MALNKLQHPYTEPLKVSALNVDGSLSVGGTIFVNGSTGVAGYLLTSTANGVQWAAAPVSLPSQTGNSGYYLTTNGTTASWVPISVPASSDPTPTVFMLMGA